MDYATIKGVHQTAVVLSGVGFFARGLAMLFGAAWVRNRLTKILPHFIDTVLLASALTLAWLLRLDPTSTPWLLAKIVGLLLYIALGVMALRPGLSQTVRAAAWIAALATLGWIISVAILKTPFGILALISRTY